MSYPQSPQQPYTQQQISPETEGASTIALWLEILFGFFGLLGIGHVYSGRTLMGIAIMIGWWIYIGVAATLISITVGIAGCFFGPLYLAIPIISGIQARTYVKKSGSKGNWLPVGFVAGGGCFLTIITILIFLFALGGLSLILGNMNY
jgi:hypothetical protein